MQNNALWWPRTYSLQSPPFEQYTVHYEGWGGIERQERSRHRTSNTNTSHLQGITEEPITSMRAHSHTQILAFKLMKRDKSLSVSRKHAQTHTQHYERDLEHTDGMIKQVWISNICHGLQACATPLSELTDKSTNRQQAMEQSTNRQ